MNAALWDVVKVPFPYTNRDVQQRRPALVVARHSGAGMPDMIWVLMITSAVHRPWPHDIVIADLRMAGLPVASVIRPVKIATIEAGMAETLGVLGQAERIAVQDFMSGLF